MARSGTDPFTAYTGSQSNKRFYHSVSLEPDYCIGCLNCIKRCPTEAVRLSGDERRAVIIPDFCIDCGECVRQCPHDAHVVSMDTMDALESFDYRVALPHPALYGQYNNLKDINILLTAFTMIGFDDVFEPSAAAELVSAASRRYVDQHREDWPLISSACPTVVRLIRIRFPNLLEHLLPMYSPMEVAGELARKRAAEKTGLAPERVGVFYISPCPSKAAAVKSPVAGGKSHVDGVLAIKDIYPLLLAVMPEAQKAPKEYSLSGSVGVGWSCTGGECKGQGHSHYVAADGIENVIRVLEDLEDEKLVDNVKFIELRSCPGGCVGGVLNVENPYVASAKLARLRKHLPMYRSFHGDFPERPHFTFSEEIDFQPVYEIGRTMAESMRAMAEVDRILAVLPGLDCGMCGCPTCRCQAEDMVRYGIDCRCMNMSRK